MQRLPPRLVPALILALTGFVLAPAARAQQAAPAGDEVELPANGLARWSWPTTPEHRKIGAVLRESRRSGPSGGPALLARLAGGGRAWLPAEIDVLLRGRVPEATQEDPPQILNEQQRALLLSALSRLPNPEVRAALETRLAATPEDPAARLGALRVVGLFGRGSDLGRLAELAPRKPGREDQALTREAREALTASAALILQRDPQAWRQFMPALQDSDPAAAKALLEALGRHPGRRSMALLLDAARMNQSLATRAVALARQCTPCWDSSLQQEFSDWMVAELSSATTEYRRMLLMSIGTLDDGTNVAALLDQLESEDQGVHDEAYTALKHVTGLAFPAQREAWQTWFAAEQGWHAGRRPKLREALESPEMPRALAALREYAEHRTRRGELAREIAPLLAHHRPELSVLACDVLARLGSNAVCDELAQLLANDDAGVARAARAALSTITGQALPADPASVRELFRS